MTLGFFISECDVPLHIFKTFHTFTSDTNNSGGSYMVQHLQSKSSDDVFMTNVFLDVF